MDFNDFAPNEQKKTNKLVWEIFFSSLCVVKVKIRSNEVECRIAMKQRITQHLCGAYSERKKNFCTDTTYV